VVRAHVELLDADEVDDTAPILGTAALVTGLVRLSDPTTPQLPNAVGAPGGQAESRAERGGGVEPSVDGAGFEAWGAGRRLTRLAHDEPPLARIVVPRSEFAEVVPPPRERQVERAEGQGVLGPQRDGGDANEVVGAGKAGRSER